MQFSMNIIMGVLGHGEYERLAKANADLLNATQPYRGAEGGILMPDNWQDL